MKNFWFAHFCTWIWKPPVISLLLFAGLAANIKCSLLLKLKNQGQTRILSAGSYPASVIDLPHNACYHIKSIRFFSFCIRLSRDYSLVIMRWIPTLQEPCTGCELPDPYSHTHTQTLSHTHTHTQSKCKYQSSTYETDSVYINISNISNFIFFNKVN